MQRVGLNAKQVSDLGSRAPESRGETARNPEMSNGRAIGVSALFMVALAAACATGGDELLGTIEAPATPDASAPGPGFCPVTCSADKRSVIDQCNTGNAVACSPTQECLDGRCVDACKSAEEGKASIGCDYYAVMMDIIPQGIGSCFVAFVTNTFSAPAHLTATFMNKPVELGTFAKLPVGEGRSIDYQPYDPVKGLAPGQVAILFLANFGGVKCPVPAARAAGAWVHGSGFGNAFRIQTDVPVVAFQMLPYGGGGAAMTGASLLLPTSAWGSNYVAANAYPALGSGGYPSLDLVAMDDDTAIQITPRADVIGLEGLFPGAKAGVPTTYTLNKGEVLQLTQQEELTGSPLISNKPFGLFGGHMCMNVPVDNGYCDHAEQQIAPVQALGNEYVATPHRARQSGTAEQYLWRIVGAADGTKLTYDPPVPGPATLDLGSYTQFTSDGPFVVKSQDDKHPFMLFAYMTGGQSHAAYGDPDFVRVVPPSQYLDRYVFFTDPTYPETSLVVTRKKTATGFEDVNLDCAGKLEGWIPLSADYEMTRTDLVRHDFEKQGKCDNGVREMSSKGTFGLTVWGWGTPETSKGVCDENTPQQDFTCYVSYGYPAGERVKQVNDVVAGPPIVK